MNIAQHWLVKSWVGAFRSLHERPLSVLLTSMTDAASLFLYGLITGLFGDLIAGETGFVGMALSDSMRAARAGAPPGFLSVVFSSPALPHTLTMLAYILTMGLLLAVAYCFLQGIAWHLARGKTTGFWNALTSFARSSAVWLFLAAAWHTTNVWLSLRSSALSVVGNTPSAAQGWLLLISAAAIIILTLLTASTGHAKTAIHLIKKHPSAVLGMILLILIVFLPWREFIGAIQAVHQQTGTIIGIITLLPLFCWARMFLINATRAVR